MRRRSDDLVTTVEAADANFAPKHGKAWWRSFLARFLSLVLIVIAISPLYLGGLPASAAHDVDGPAVTPEPWEGNPRCAVATNLQGGGTNPPLQRAGQNWSDLSTNTAPPAGTSVYSNSDLTVTITVDSTGKFATWTASIGIDGVLMKSGQSFFYRYDDPNSGSDPGELTHDDELTTPGSGNAISHMVFCYDLDPDLTVAKSASKSTIQPGESFTYSITARNIGGGTANAVTITDDLDDDLTITSATFDNDPLSGGGTGTCSFGSGNTVTCSVGDLGPNDKNTTAPEQDTAIVTIQVTAPPDSCDDLVNQARVSANNEPSNVQGNNTSNQVTVNVVCANVTILKSAPVGTIDAGDLATFTIRVTSTGDTTATGVTVSDTLPSGIPWTDDSTQCSISGNLLTCNFGDLGPGESRSVTITGPTGADDCGTRNNTATVAATNEPASLRGDNSSSASITIQCGRMEILKTSDAASVSAGDQIGFTILVTNTGIGSATDVRVTDTLPTNDGVSWTIDGGTGQAQCSINANVLTCNFGTMAQNATKTVHISSGTTAQTCGVVSNTAEVGTSNDGTASSTASTTVNCPDMVISKVGNGPINAGDVASFTIVVTNTGAGIARDVSVSDTLPGGVTWATNSAGCAVANGNELTCNFGDISPGATRTVTVSGTTDADECGVLDNTGFVAATNEANTTNNSDDATITVLCPDVTVLKQGNGPIAAGDTAAFTILVSNTGGGVAKNVTLTDVLPPGISWTEANDPSNSCGVTFVGGSDILSCNFGDLAAGETRTVTVSGVTDAQDCGELANTAAVDASNEPASAPDPNRSSASITVQCATIDISKTADSASVTAGDSIGFTILVTNNGPGRADGVTVTDTLPSNGGLDWDIDGGTGASDCSISSGVLTCNFGSLQSGATRTVHISSPTTAASCGTVNNTAFVATTNDGSDSDADTVSVTCPTLGISIVKTVAPISGSPGTIVTYTYVVQNTGEATLFNISIDDDKLGHIGVIPQLDPGQSTTLLKASVLGTAGVINIATATGTDRLGRSVSDSDDASVSVILPLTLERILPPAAPAAPAVAPQTVARTAPQAIATTGVELWPPMLSAFLMILLGSAALRGSRVRPQGEFRWAFQETN